jgi:hypothetical protein
MAISPRKIKIWTLLLNVPLGFNSSHSCSREYLDGFNATSKVEMSVETAIGLNS